MTRGILAGTLAAGLGLAAVGCGPQNQTAPPVDKAKQHDAVEQMKRGQTTKGGAPTGDKEGEKKADKEGEKKADKEGEKKPSKGDK
jgi:hypothetical protein